MKTWLSRILNLTLWLVGSVLASTGLILAFRPVRAADGASASPAGTATAGATCIPGFPTPPSDWSSLTCSFTRAGFGWSPASVAGRACSPGWPSASPCPPPPSSGPSRRAVAVIVPRNRQTTLACPEFRGSVSQTPRSFHPPADARTANLARPINSAIRDRIENLPLVPQPTHEPRRRLGSHMPRKVQPPPPASSTCRVIPVSIYNPPRRVTLPVISVQ